MWGRLAIPLGLGNALGLGVRALDLPVTPYESGSGELSSTDVLLPVLRTPMSAPLQNVCRLVTVCRPLHSCLHEAECPGRSRGLLWCAWYHVM